MKQLVALTLLLVLMSCAQQMSTQTRQDAVTETARLQGLAVQGTLTQADTETLQSLVAQDDDASHEVEEIALLASFNEQEHAAHGLSFLASYLETGQELLCPAHALGHYYVFTRHGATHEAQDALDEVEEDLPAWVKAAKVYDAQYPSGQDIDAIAARIDADLARIHTGDTSATDEEIAFLTNEGSICVPE